MAQPATRGGEASWGGLSVLLQLLLMLMGVKGLGFWSLGWPEALSLGPPLGHLCMKIIAVGLAGSWRWGAHFRTGFPEAEEDLGVDGRPEGPFWPPAG